MSTVTKLSLPPRSLAIGAGHELAFEMFEEFLGEDGSASQGDQALLDPDYRHGRPYRDVISDYLERARKAGPDVERGFTMILSDLVATVTQGDCPGVCYGHYEALMRRRVISDGPRQAARREKARRLVGARRERRRRGS
jgi:hypothetical protein